MVTREGGERGDDLRSLVTEQRVADVLGVVARTVRTYAARGYLKRVYLPNQGAQGARVRYEQADVERFIAERRAS
jgi:predicted site-specific integrase-resolvase